MRRSSFPPSYDGEECPPTLRDLELERALEIVRADSGPRPLAKCTLFAPPEDLPPPGGKRFQRSVYLTERSQRIIELIAGNGRGSSARFDQLLEALLELHLVSS